MPHDIIDNHEIVLLDELAARFPSSEAAKFAVGYFFLSGLEPLRDRLYNLKELRLLIGNTTNRETIEQISEGYRRLDAAREVIEAQRYPKRAEVRAQVEATVAEVRAAAEQMEQTDADEQLVAALVQMISEERLKVRVYTRGRLHAKAYIFDYAQAYDAAGRALPRTEPGVAIVGSSNFTLSGISHNTELNVVVHGRENHARLTDWFEGLWADGEPFDAALMAELRQSWALAQHTPYDIYMKTLYTLVRDRLEETEDRPFLWNDDIMNRLAEFQRVAVRQAVQTIGRFGGCFVADVVGLGKSYIGAAVVKHFERVERARPLIICPRPLVGMWERYNEVYQLNAHVVSMSLLRASDDGNLLLDDVRYKDRDFVLVDESHNFRNPDSQRYRVLQQYLSSGGRRCVLLTATPRTRDAWDVYHQLRLFHPGDSTTIPIDPPHLRQYFVAVEAGQRSLPELLSHILIRRTRAHIVRWYGYDAETHARIAPEDLPLYRSNQRRAYVEVGGRKQSFPRRELQTLDYSIEATYAGLYDQLRAAMGSTAADVPQNGRTLRYARYGLWNYVLAAKRQHAPYSELQRAGTNLRGLMRTMLFKRFESSVDAFRHTLRRMQITHRAFLRALDDNIIPAGEDAALLLHEAEQYEDSVLLDALREAGQRYSASDFRSDALRADVAHDLGVLEEMLELVTPITAIRDAKLQRLLAYIASVPPTGKLLIFSQYADTARYLFDALSPEQCDPTIEVVYSNDRDKARLVARFSPRSNPQLVLRANDAPIRVLITTDVLSEGLNLQDCDTVINYDLHWNPVRLIQRFGRIDRIGTEYDTIYGINFLPERALEQNLGLHEILRRRIREIHETIGEDAAVLEPGEALNEGAMYAIYAQGDSTVLDDEDDATVGLNEAEELLRQLRTDDPAEYERIANLRNGIRAGRYNTTKGRVVYCQAGAYQQLLLLDAEGTVVTRDIPTILGVLRATPDEIGLPVDPVHNQLVAAAKANFAREAWQRYVEQQQTESLSTVQRFVVRELRAAFAQTTDADLQGQISTLEAAFRRPLSRAVLGELQTMRRASLDGLALVMELSHLYTRYGLNEQRQVITREETPQAPLVVCSAVLV